MASDAALSVDEVRTLEGLLAKVAGDGNLPAPLFKFIVEATATPNIDLIVLDDEQRILLAWREDPFGRGWHVPGSLIRHREEVAARLAATAQVEFGAEMRIAPKPFAAVQIFDDRGHSIGLCHLATLTSDPQERMFSGVGVPAAGELCWFGALPAELYPSHELYRKVIAALRAGELAAEIPIFTQLAGSRNPRPHAVGGTINARRTPPPAPES